jgi:hypothetical protein
VWRLRRFQFTLLAVVVAVVGAVAWHFFSGPSSKDCAPVHELLSFNKTQIDYLNSKTHIPDKGSFEQETEPSDLDYRNWRDGIDDRAAKVTAQDLAPAAKELAQTADRLVEARIQLSAAEQGTAPGAPAPPVAMLVSALYDQYQAEVGQLAKTCSG